MTRLPAAAPYEKDAKRVYYLSLEFLMGRTLGNAILNLGIQDTAQALVELGYTLEDLREAEWGGPPRGPGDPEPPIYGVDLPTTAAVDGVVVSWSVRPGTQGARAAARVGPVG